MFTTYVVIEFVLININIIFSKFEIISLILAMFIFVYDDTKIFRGCFDNYNLILNSKNQIRNINKLVFLSMILIILNYIIKDEIYLTCLNNIIKYLIILNSYIFYKYAIKSKVLVPVIDVVDVSKKINIIENSFARLNYERNKEINFQLKLNEQIKERTNLLNNVLKIIPDAWIVFNRKLDVKFHNHKFSENFREKEEVIYSLKDILILKIEENKENEERILLEDEFIHICDEVYMISIFRDLKKGIYLITLNNVTKEERELKEMYGVNRYFRKVIQKVPLPIMSKRRGQDGKYYISNVNISFKNMFGMEFLEIVGLEFSSFIEKYNIDIYDENIFGRRELTFEEKMKEIERYHGIDEYVYLIFKNKNGKDTILETSFEEYDSRNKIFKLMIFKDVTAEMKSSKNIYRNKLFYEKILDAIPNAVCVETLKEGRLIFVNRCYDKMFAINDENLNYKRQKYRDVIIKKFIADKKSNPFDSVTILDDEKELKEISMIKNIVKFGSEDCMLRIFTDMKEKRKLEEITLQLSAQREHDNMKTQFYSNLSHELKTPLNNIFSSLQLLEQSSKKGIISEKKSILNQHMKITKTNMFMLIRLIDNIINVSQVKDDLYKIEPKKINIVEHIELITDSLISYIDVKKLKFMFDTNNEDIVVNLDPESIERIILNLISNSIKFTHEGGEILVGVYKVLDKVHIVVKDTGIGIDEKELSEIFDRFKQIESKEIENETGSGIGLFLTKSLIEIQGGDISIESKKGEGTTITVTFDIVEESNEEITHITRDNLEKFELEFFDAYDKTSHMNFS
jgi:signal transduction histidine kinase/PAS domain-containing protein